MGGGGEFSLYWGAFYSLQPEEVHCGSERDEGEGNGVEP